MKLNFATMRGAGRCVTILAFIAATASSAFAQVPTSVPPVSQPTAISKPAPQTSPTPQTSPLPETSPTPQASPTPPSLERRFFRNLLRDQRAIWTSPLRVRGDDARFLAPLGAATAALIATDRRTAGALDDDDERLDVSRGVSAAGSFYASGGTALAFYLVGRGTGNARARETGLLAAEALINGSIVSGVLKAATQRPRPREERGHGRFFDEGNSFPSGHAISAWSVATVVAQEYHDRPLIRFSAYGIAAAVSASRYTGRKHFLSDALVGSAIGYGIGRYVYRKHHDPNLDSRGDVDARRDGSQLLPLILPNYDRRTRSYGLGLSWGF